MGLERLAVKPLLRCLRTLSTIVLSGRGSLDASKEPFSSSDREGGRTEGAKHWHPVGRSTSIRYRSGAGFDPAGPKLANGSMAMRLLRSTYVLSLSGRD
jgi:hypothetical protein